VIPPLNERALYYLYVVAERGGVRAGADHLGMDPATVSRAVAHLEEEVGAVLLERQGRGVHPTEAGEVLLQHFRWLRAQRNDALTRLGELKSMDRGTIDLALGEGFIEDLHDGALTAFCSSYPGIVINQYVAGSNDIVHMVAEGDVHVGLIYHPPPDSRIQPCGSWVQPLCVMVPPRHPLLKRNGPVGLADVAAYPSGLLHGSFGVRQLVDMAAAVARVQLVPRLTSNSFGALREFVCAGLGVAFMPAFAARRAIAAGHLHAIALADAVLAKAEAAVITQRRRQLPDSASKLVECMAKTMHAFGGEA
jgi:DNA-binding transcriptional LysR family regulator